MNILLLSAYHAASHQRWAAGLMQQFPEYHWTLLDLPPRHFNWRIRGNSLTWALQQKSVLSQPYDLLVVTSMVDLSALRGFVPELAAIPTIVYFHENQFAYPKNARQFNSVEPQILSIYSAFCADQLIFNSAFNRQTFFAGARELFNKLPDGVEASDLAILEAKASVIPVPLEAGCYLSDSVKAPGRAELIWNHRWEYDKGPDRLLKALEKLPDIPYTLHVVGQQFRRQPAVFEDIKSLLIERHALGEWGYLESSDDYRRLLGRCHGVISTALHDFQGLAVLEAVAAGCVPLVPRRQAYPEWFGDSTCYESDEGDVEREAGALAEQLCKLIDKVEQGDVGVAPSLDGFRWQTLAEAYRREFELVYHSAP